MDIFLSFSLISDEPNDHAPSNTQPQRAAATKVPILFRFYSALNDRYCGVAFFKDALLDS